MRHRRLYQRVLLTVVVLTLAVTIVVFIGYRRITREPGVLLDLVKKKPTCS
jgi:hypothetical protein